MKMKEYDEKLEELLLKKPYGALNAGERSYADHHLRGEEGYTSAREMRQRTRALLLGESAPADKAGLAAVMARVRPRRWSNWQVAAAVFLAALLAWSARGLLPESPPIDTSRLAVADTVWKEVKIRDTVYLPAPMNERAVEKLEPPIRQVKDWNKTPDRRRMPRPKEEPGAISPKLAATMAQLPSPGSIAGQGGKSGGIAVQGMEGEATVDKFKLE